MSVFLQRLERTGLLLVLLFCGAGIGLGAEEDPPDSVWLHLRWGHQFQFAGYYAAQEKGYFASEGLVVNILPGTSTDQAVAGVGVEDAHYGIAGTDLLVRRAEGAPLIVIAAIFQHSPHTLAVRSASSIFRPEDLKGARVMANPSRDTDLKAMFLQQHVPLSSMEFVSGTWDVAAFANGEVDAISCYATTQEYTFQQKGIGYRLIQPANFGVDFYGDCLFTTEKELADHPDRVRAFRRASLRGWHYAMDHPEEVIHLILHEHPQADTVEAYNALAFEAAAMQRYLLTDLVEVGTMSMERWRRIADVYADVGMVPRDMDVQGFVYDPEHREDPRLMHRLLLGGLFLALIVGSIIVWNLQLRREVRRRTTEMEQKNLALEEENSRRRLVEKALRESEGKLRTLMEALPDLVLFRDQEGTWTEVSALARETFGLSHSEEEGRGHDSVAERFLREEEANAAASRDSRSHDRSERRIMGRDGKETVLDVIRAPVIGPEGDVRGRVVIGHDITSRKRVEGALAEANQALNAIISAAPIAIIAMNADNSVIEWNPAAEALFGWKSDDVMGRPLPIVPPERREEQEGMFRDVMHGEPYAGRVLRRVTNAGVAVDVYASSAPLRDAAGRISGAVAMFMDLTDTLRTQNQLRVSLNEKEILLKEIHHRVKNNLQVISSLLSLQAERITDTRARDVFRESQNRVRSMAMIHERLYRSQDLANVDIGEYVRSLTVSLFNSYRTNVPAVRCDVDVEPIQLEIDLAIPAGLVLNELISNSLKYAFPDGREGLLSVSLKMEGEEIVLAVRDDGVGLPEGFHPEDASSLGYQLVTMLVEQLHGTLTLESRGGVAARVAFTPKKKGNGELDTVTMNVPTGAPRGA